MKLNTGVWYGMPIAIWPLYAEQQMRAFLLVRELELAVATNESIFAGDGAGIGC